MVASTVSILLFGLAVSSALPEYRNDINWPNRPNFWPENLPWPPSNSEGWPERPSWWPLPNWPPSIPNQWPATPQWWPEYLPWPPTANPDLWPAPPAWWPEGLPWPPARPEQWPEQPDFWPENLPWPPGLPEDKPDWWPDMLDWPPTLPQIPEGWRPTIPDIPEEQPSWWPDMLPWPPALPDLEGIWPPPGIDTDMIPYIPSRDNQFHLFTRQNPSVSQPLLIHYSDILRNSNYDPSRRTIVLVHDIEETGTSNFNQVLVQAFLIGADVNVIVVDWSAGAYHGSLLSTAFSALSGNFVSRFINFLVAATAGDLDDFHLVGLGLGAWNVGFIGMRLGRQVGYITLLDPPQGHELLSNLPALSINAGKYTECIHTDIGQRGYSQALAHVDFYPNGGSYQPGCGGQSLCNRDRSVYFLAESVQTGGFSSVECESWTDATEGNCHGRSLNLGGLKPKTGERGVFHLSTNNQRPFSRG